MSGERAVTARRRLAGEICWKCSRILDPDPFGRKGERACDHCGPAAVSIRHEVYLTFFLREAWHCSFIEADARTQINTLHFATSDKLVELIRRAGGLKDSAAKQTLAYAIEKGRGGMTLYLTAEQYRKLKR